VQGIRTSHTALRVLWWRTLTPRQTRSRSAGDSRSSSRCLVLGPRVILGLVPGPGMALNPGLKTPLYIADGKQSIACLKEVLCSIAQYNTV
jgi:hypothetical protein